jgi:hypothetical protein
MDVSRVGYLEFSGTAPGIGYRKTIGVFYFSLLSKTGKRLMR